MNLIKSFAFFIAFFSVSVFAVDIDNDGSMAEEETLAGTSDNNPDERPYWWKTFPGVAEDDDFGRSLSSAGDVNGDGYVDIVVGAPGSEPNGAYSGSAQVVSVIDGNVLYTHDGVAGALFGRAVSGAGDVNQDGYGDYIIGGKGEDTGRARVFSGVDGSLIYLLDGGAGSDEFGDAVGAAGDVNNDGYADVIVGDPWHDGNGNQAGMAQVFSGIDGAVLYTLYGDNARDQLGRAVSGAGDVNQDGYDDFIVGAWLDDNTADAAGSATLYSGIDGTVLYSFDGDLAGDRFGIAVSDAGDVNADGYPDVIIGAYQTDFNGSSSGSAMVYSGASGNKLFQFNGIDKGGIFGNAVSVAGDVNNDGYDDLLVGAVQEDYSDDITKAGSVSLFSGTDGYLMAKFTGAAINERLGASVSALGDMDGDGYDDLLIGADNGNYARVILGGDLINDVDTDFLVNSADSDDDGDEMPDSWELLYGLDPLRNDDALTDFDGDAVLNLKELLEGTDPTVANVQNYDLDKDSDSDLIFYEAGSGALTYWQMQDGEKQTGVWINNFPGMNIVAMLDIDADLDVDILLENPSNSVVSVWESGVIDTSSFYGLSYQTGYSVVATGDLDNDGDGDLVLQDASDNIVVWILENGGQSSSAWLGNWSQLVKLTADTDADGDDDIVTDDGSGNVIVIEVENGAKQQARWIGQWSGYSVAGSGDVDNDGDEDIFMENAGDVIVVEMENGQKVIARWLGVWSNTNIVGVGDIDADADTDLIQQDSSTGSVQVVEIENGQKVTARWLGTFAYTTKGVADVNADGDVDVVLQDGSGNVALIELENGSKLGGAKWLGVNTGEVKLFP